MPPTARLPASSDTSVIPVVIPQTSISRMYKHFVRLNCATRKGNCKGSEGRKFLMDYTTAQMLQLYKEKWVDTHTQRAT